MKLAVLFFAIVAASADALRGQAQDGSQAPLALSEARRLADLGLFRPAAESLQSRWNNRGGAVAERRQAGELLADIYYRSGEYDEALEIARERLALEERQPVEPSSPSQALERAASRLLLSWILVARGRPDDLAEAERSIDDAASAARLHAQVDRLLWLEILFQKAEIVHLQGAAKTPPLINAAEQHWAEVERHSRQIAAQFIGARSGEGEVFAKSAVLYARRWSLCGRPKEAEAALRMALLDAGWRLTPEDGESLWRELAAVLRRSGEPSAELEAWREALAWFDKREANEPDTLETIDLSIRRGDLHAEAAAAAWRAGERTASATYLDRSEQFFGQAMAELAEWAATDGASSAPDVLSRELAALDGLMEVLNKRREFAGGDPTAPASGLDAFTGRLQPMLEQSRLAKDPRIYQWRTSLAAHLVDRGQFPAARPHLESAVAFFRNRDAARDREKDSLALARGLNLLSEVERVEGGFEKARQMLGESLALYERERLQDEQLLLTIWINHGRLAATSGQYGDARDWFERARERAARSDPPLVEAHSVALLNEGLLMKTVGRLDEAESYCAQALDLMASRREASDPQLLPYYAGLIGLQLARISAAPAEHDAAAFERLKELAARAESIRSEAAKKRAAEPNAGAQLDLLIRHQQAMVHYLAFARDGAAAEREAAERLWREILPIQQAQQWPLEQARTLHYLSRLDFVAWRRREEENRRLFRDWLARQSAHDDACRAFDARLAKHDAAVAAFVADRKKYNTALDSFKIGAAAAESAEARRESHEALTKDFRRLGASRDRLNEQAKKFRESAAKLEAKRERLEGERSSLDSQAPDAEAADRLASSRRLAEGAMAILDALAIEPSLQYAATCNYAEVLHAQSRASGDVSLHERAIGRLEQAVELVEKPRVAVFGEDVARAEFFARFSTAYELLVNWLVEDGRVREALVFAERRRNRTFLDRIKQESLRAAMLSESRGYANVLPAALGHAEAEAAVERWSSGSQTGLYYFVGSSQSFVFLLGKRTGGVAAFPLAAGDPTLAEDALQTDHVSSAWIGRAVDAYRNILDRGDLTAQSPQRLAVLAGIARVLAPPEVRGKIASLGLSDEEHIVVFPDDRLYQLPLDALLVEAAPRQVFLFDEFPAIAYVPSLLIHQTLAERPSSTEATRVLTVGYPELTGLTSESSPAARRYLPVAAVLPDLQASQRESRRVMAAFGSHGAEQLLGNRASESEVRRALSQSPVTYFHVATHGVADTRANRFGSALVLSSGDAADSATDGFLELDEIYELPLNGCEFAALSACNTHVGGSLPLEMGASLSRAFLVAGARRVFCSQWPVADESSEALTGALFEQIAQEHKRRPAIHYAVALKKAQRQLRAAPDGKWNDPRHWAAFVLVGPGE